MNNLYHKVAVASICTAVGFVLGASKEAKAASFTLAPTIIFQVVDGFSDVYDGLGDELFPGFFNYVEKGGIPNRGGHETAPFAEFSIGNFSVAPHTFINSAIFQTEISSFLVSEGLSARSLDIFGYVGNGTAEVSAFEAGVFLSSVDVSSSSPGDILNFDVTPFVHQRVSNDDAFAGFGIRITSSLLSYPNYGRVKLGDSYYGKEPSLIIETVDVAEPVPEPTTIFGSALALGVGGWLKPKKSSQQNKTTSQR